jgi:hypothetical protein
VAGDRQLSLYTITSVGTYDIGKLVALGSVPQWVDLSYRPRDTTWYESPSTIDSKAVGSITVTELTATSLSATFHATLPIQSGTGDSSVVVTDGAVNVTFQ